jgi:hypothetical protein
MLTNGGRATVAGHGAGAVRALVIAGGNPDIAPTSTLDLADNVLVVKNGSLNGIQLAITAGFDGGDWLGVGGITSGAAANDRNGLTALGVASNAALGKRTFAGVSGLSENDLIVKYTYYGDADLSGDVTLDDFTQFLAAINRKARLQTTGSTATSTSPAPSRSTTSLNSSSASNNRRRVVTGDRRPRA